MRTLLVLAVVVVLLTRPGSSEQVEAHTVPSTAVTYRVTATTTSTAAVEAYEPPSPQPVDAVARTAPTVRALSAGGDVWDRLANCESDGRWSLHDSIHQGGLQFAVGTWDAYVAKGKPYELVGFPDDAHLASREQQIAVALRVRDGVPSSSGPYLNPQGWGAWPRCSRTIGVR